MYCSGRTISSQLILTSLRIEVCILVAVLQYYSGVKCCYPFKRKIVRENLFFSVCTCFDPKIILLGKDVLYLHGGLNGDGDSYLVGVIRFSKVFRLHAIFHDTAGAANAEKGSCLRFYYVIGCITVSCLLGHITGLVFRLYAKVLLPFTFNMFDC